MQDVELADSEVKARATRGAVAAFSRHAVVRLLAFLGTLLLTRLLAPAEFGLFSTSQFCLTVVSAVCVGGVISALVRRAEHVSAEEFHTAFALQLGFAAIACGAMFLAAPLIADIYGLPATSAWVFRAMSAAVFAISLKSIPQAMLQRQLRHDLVAASEIVEYVTYIGVALLLAWMGWGVWALVTATLVRYSSAVVVLHVMARRAPVLAFNRSVAGRLARFALPLQGTALLDLANRAVAPLLLGGLLGMSAVGVASIANTMLEALILQPLVLLSAVQFRLLARAQRDPARVRRLLGEFYFMGAAAIMPIALLLICAAPLLSYLFPPAWSDVVWLVPALFLASVVQVIASPTAQAAKALGILNTPLLAGAINLAIQCVILALTHQQLGLASYPLAAAVGAVAAAAIMLARVTRAIGPAPFGPVVPVVLAGAAAALIWWPAARAGSLWIVVSGAALGALLYIVILALTAGRRVRRYLVTFADNALPRAPSLGKFVTVMGDLVARVDISGSPAEARDR